MLLRSIILHGLIAFTIPWLLYENASAQPPEIPSTEFDSNSTESFPKSKTERLLDAQNTAISFLVFAGKAPADGGATRSLNPDEYLTLNTGRYPVDSKIIFSYLGLSSPVGAATTTSTPELSFDQMLTESYARFVSAESGTPIAGLNKLKSIYRDAALSYAPQELRDELNNSLSDLFDAQEVLVERILKESERLAVSAEAVLQNPASTAEQKTAAMASLQEANNEAYKAVSDEFQIYAKAHVLEGYERFFSKRSSFKESVLARANAFRLTCELDTKNRYSRFMKLFGPFSPEFPIALEFKRAASLRDVLGELAREQDKQKQVKLLANLLVEDIGAPHAKEVFDRAVAISIEIESARSVPDREAEANKLLRQILDLHDRYKERTGVSFSNLAAISPQEFKKGLEPQSLSIGIERDIKGKVLAKYYEDTNASLNFRVFDFFIDLLRERLDRNTEMLLTSIRSEFSKTRSEIAAHLAEVTDRLDAIDENMVKLEDSLGEMRKATFEKLDELHANTTRRLNGIQGVLDSVASEVHLVLANTEQIKATAVEQLLATKAARRQMLPPAWPGENDTDTRLVLGALPDDVTNGIAGVLEGRLREHMKNYEFSDSKSISRKEWRKWGPVKTIIAEYTVRYSYLLKPVEEECHFNIPSIRGGFDRETGEVYVFLDLKAMMKVKGHASIAIENLAGSGQHDFSGDLHIACKARVVLDLKTGRPSAQLKEGESFELRVGDLTFSGDLLNLCRNDIESALNGKLTEKKPDIEMKIKEVLDSRAGAMGSLYEKVLKSGWIR